MPTLQLRAPEDYRLERDVCSYGYFRLAPNRWDPEQRGLQRTLLVDRSVVQIQVRQKGSLLVIESSRAVRPIRRELVKQIRRMLRLDMTESMVAEFHKTDPRWKLGGRARLFRSPTLFEDVIKTVTSCNVTWSATITMNRRLCQVCGGREGEAAAFPEPAQLATRRPAFLRSRCSLGYRDARVVELARLWRARSWDWLEDEATSDEEVHAALIELPGIGPYAAANIMQLLGRFGRLPLDTEAVRHGRTVLGFRGRSPEVARRVRQHFSRFGSWAFLSYWLEMWDVYEREKGPAWTWE